MNWLSRILGRALSALELKVEFIRALRTARHDVIMTVRVNDDIMNYRGSVTVWRDTDTGERPGTALEAKLAALYAKHVEWSEPKVKA